MERDTTLLEDGRGDSPNPWSDDDDLSSTMRSTCSADLIIFDLINIDSTNIWWTNPNKIFIANLGESVYLQCLNKRKKKQVATLLYGYKIHILPFIRDKSSKRYD
jgi:hypothetical protein